MSQTFLEFERPIGELMSKIDDLRLLSNSSDINISQDIKRLEQETINLTERIFAKLTPWQKTLLSRHPDRPFTSDYLETVFGDFKELHGDRVFGDDESIIGGLAVLDKIDVMVIGQEKGRGTKEKVRRNFGMSRPEGYRKALRLMKLAEKFKLPVICLIDTPGAYPGKGAEERGQAEAIARNLKEMAALKVPILSVVIGEGGSGGALALGMGNRVLMMQYATYSVISPEGCASILWKDSSKAELASEALRLTAQDILELKVIDEIIPEPIGGAHRNPLEAATILQRRLVHHLQELRKKSPKVLVKERFDKFMSMGVVLDGGATL
ncbi:MAG: acetyl-CoA carboxylase carboxyltransferase subunit alpha [Magnetococcales bacterium]|nr:acetyl-CoA carboxylase carboxyltransferase subunit alpha [Magnetococcales bacterium]MBF0437506.1 acetyl-CoA carboxylase carboxyltransferase subunit alpha [Magnetococcales bacterium]